MTKPFAYLSSLTLKRAVAPVALLGLAQPALAHPGEHGSSWFAAALHLLSEPDHLAGLAIGLLVALVLARAGLRRLGARPERSRKR